MTFASEGTTFSIAQRPLLRAGKQKYRLHSSLALPLCLPLFCISFFSHNKFTLNWLCRYSGSWYKLMMDGWTETGRKIQSLSKPCPIPVQCTSKKRSCRGFVEALSRYSPSSVEPLSSSQTLGHTLDRQIQRLSKACPLQWKIVQFSTPDKLGTDFGLRK